MTIRTSNEWYPLAPPQQANGGSTRWQWLTNGNCLRIVVTTNLSEPIEIAPPPDPFIIIRRPETDDEPGVVEGTIVREVLE